MGSALTIFFLRFTKLNISKTFRACSSGLLLVFWSDVRLVAEEIFQVLLIHVSLQLTLGCEDHLINSGWWAYARQVKV